MNADIKQKWLDAMRSGEYPQTVGVLHRTEPYSIPGDSHEFPVGYCCLGVLCAVLPEHGKFDDLGHFQYISSGVFEGPGTSIQELPKSILRAVGLTDAQQRDLMKLNDSERKNFAQIADYIEANL